jgi:hypothetical protein
MGGFSQNGGSPRGTFSSLTLGDSKALSGHWPAGCMTGSLHTS